MNHADAYARALFAFRSLDASHIETRVDAFIKHVTREGKQALLPSIVRAYERRVHEATRRAPTIHVAKKDDVPRALAAYEKTFDTQEMPAVFVDESLIGGWSMQKGSRRIDHTYKTALLLLYRSMRNH